MLSLGEAATAGVLSAYVVPYAAATIVAGQRCEARGPAVATVREAVRSPREVDTRQSA